MTRRSLVFVAALAGLLGLAAPAAAQQNVEIGQLRCEAGASATVGAGLGASASVGGSDRFIALQPHSTQTQGGLDLTAGVESLTLWEGT